MRPEDDNGKDRCELLAEYIIDTGDTVRAAAAKFGVSKSTVHKDITERLEKRNPAMYRDVKQVLEQNKTEVFSASEQKKSGRIKKKRRAPKRLSGRKRRGGHGSPFLTERKGKPFSRRFKNKTAKATAEVSLPPLFYG